MADTRFNDSEKCRKGGKVSQSSSKLNSFDTVQNLVPVAILVAVSCSFSSLVLFSIEQA